LKYLNQSQFTQKLLNKKTLNQVGFIQIDSVTIKKDWKAALLIYRINEERFVLPLNKNTTGSWQINPKRSTHAEYYKQYRN